MSRSSFNMKLSIGLDRPELVDSALMLIEQMGGSPNDQLIFLEQLVDAVTKNQPEQLNDFLITFPRINEFCSYEGFEKSPRYKEFIETAQRAAHAFYQANKALQIHRKKDVLVWRYYYSRLNMVVVVAF